MRARLPLSLLSSLLLSGCVIVFDAPEPADPAPDPSPPPSPPTGTQARQAFDRDVYPILLADCAACHAAKSPPPSGFGFIVPGDPDATYELVKASGFLTADPYASRLLTKGLHDGPPLQGDEIEQIRRWLDLEAAGL